MRILVDSHVFDGMFQGSRTYIEGLYKEMIAQRPDWEFYLLAHDIDNLKAIFGDADNITFLKLKATNKYKRLLIEIPRHIKKNKIDYAHFQYVVPLQKSCKFIVTIHDILFEEPRFKKYFTTAYRKKNGLLFKRAAKQADVLLTVSEYSKQKISNIYHRQEQDIFVIPNAVEPSTSASDINISEKYGCGKYLLYVSRIEPRKNHRGLVEAYLSLQLDKNDYELVFIGKQDIPDASLDKLIHENKDRLKDKLHFYENIPDEDMKSFIAQSEIVVYPSFAEGFGIPPLEGAIQKKQVVCSSATAMAEFDFFRYHIDPANSNELEDAIVSALTDNDQLYLENVVNTILEKYNWRRSAKDLISILENQ